MSRHLATSVAFALALCAAAPAAGVDWTLSLGFERTRGDFGLPFETRTDYYPVSLRARSHPWSARIGASRLEISGERFTADGGTAPREESGTGDTVLALERALDTWRAAGTWVELGLEVKLPTGDESAGLSTGEQDTTVEVDVYLLRGDWTPFATLGYKAVGKAPGLELQDQWLATVGLARRVGPRLSTGALLDYRDRSSPRTARALEALLYLSWRAHRGLALMGYAIDGFEDGSPEQGLGLQALFYF